MAIDRWQIFSTAALYTCNCVDRSIWQPIFCAKGYFLHELNVYLYWKQKKKRRRIFIGNQCRWHFIGDSALALSIMNDFLSLTDGCSVYTNQGLRSTWHYSGNVLALCPSLLLYACQTMHCDAKSIHHYVCTPLLHKFDLFTIPAEHCTNKCIEFEDPRRA